MKCRIKIDTNQYDESGKLDKIETTYLGESYNKKNEMYFIYKEEYDGENITNTIKLYDDMLSMIKYGKTTSTMTFEENTSNTSKYRTSYGVFLIDVLTDKLVIDKKEKHINIYIEYNINIKDLFIGKNEVSIFIEMI